MYLESQKLELIQLILDLQDVKTLTQISRLLKKPASKQRPKTAKKELLEQFIQQAPQHVPLSDDDVMEAVNHSRY